MHYKLIAADMDGTLLNRAEMLSPRTAETVRRLRATGAYFILSTGRPYPGVTRFVRQLSLTGPVITYNGAEIVLAETGEQLCAQGLDAADAEAILQLGRRLGAIMTLWSRGTLYVSSFCEATERYRQISGVEAHLLTPRTEAEVLRRGVTKVLYIGTVEQMQPYITAADGIIPATVSYCTSRPNFLEFVSAAVSKASALEQVGRLTGTDPAEMIAIGDGFNDLPMLRFAGLGLTVANAPEAVQKEADAVMPSNEEDGVAVAIERYMLGE